MQKESVNRRASEVLGACVESVDAVGTTRYAYTLGNQLYMEYLGPFTNSAVTNFYAHRQRTNMSVQQLTGVWTNRFAC